MSLPGIDTGDPNADKVLQFIVARLQQSNPTLRQDYLDGTISATITHCSVHNALNIPHDDIKAALAYLHEQDYLRVEFTYFNASRVWLRCRVLDKTA